jgi:threonine/homoserine/homoserine lactone efflux protein
MQFVQLKVVIIYSGIFVSLLPQHVSTWVYFILPLLIFTVEAGWYVIVTLVLSSKTPRAHYLKSKSIIDKASAAIMGGLGAKLISSMSD